MLWPIAMVPYGLDFTDFGFTLANAQLTWCCVESIPAAGSIWLSNVVAGAWLAIMGGQAIAVRVLWLLALWGTLALAWFALPKSLRPTHPAVPLGLALASTVAATANWFTYNTLTGLMLTAATCLLLQQDSHRGRRLGGAALAGFLVGFAMFARLPNLTAIALVVIVPLTANTDARSTARRSLLFLASAAIGVAFGFALLKILGALPGWLAAVRMLSGMAADDGSSHGIYKLLRQTLEMHARYLLTGGITVAAAVAG
ncbi:MAG: hypothetical protein KJZ59_06290, partial [Pararhodobacter sp.]|nr:hypothetical protein [Pararhodobacter sp.]